MSELEEQYQKVIERLKLLSLPYQEQMECFPEFVDAPFEILDTFDNAFLLLPNLIEARQFSISGIANLLRLHNLINSTSNNPLFKDLAEEDFNKSSEWNKVRELASETLKLLGESIEKPNILYL